MAITVEAVYENGVLRPAQPLPLKEHETVRVTILTGDSPLLRDYGIMAWAGDPEVLRSLAEDVELDPQERP